MKKTGSKNTQKLSLRVRLCIKLALITTAGCAFIAFAIFMFIGTFGTSEKAQAVQGKNGPKTISTTNVISNEFTTLNTTAAVSAVQVTPDPFTESFIAEFESVEKKEAQFQLLNVNEAIIFNDKIMVEEGKNSFRFTAPSNLKPGTYVLKIMSGKSVLASAKISKS